MFQVFIFKPVVDTAVQDLQSVATFSAVEKAWAFVDDPNNAWFLVIGGPGSSFKVFGFTAAEITR